VLARIVSFVCAVVLVACQTSASRGATCSRDDDCASPTVCALGRCRAACRTSRDCEVGTRCLVEPATGIGVCSVPEVDTCPGGSCPAGFVCQGGECLNACGAIVACPDGVCSGDACLPILGDAGVLTDAGLDAGASCHGPGCDPVVQLEIGGPRTYVVTAAGLAWAWGGSGTSALGDALIAHGSCADCAPTPVRVLAADGSPLDRVAQITAGAEHACALRTDGTVWCWGYGSEGQLGQGGGPSPTPVQVVDGTGAALDAVTVIAAGRGHTCAIRGAAREVWCWGQNDSGQLGDGTMIDSPVAVHATAFVDPAHALAVSQEHTLTVLDDATMRGIGFDQCGVVGTTLTDGADVLVAVTGPVTSIASLATTTWDTCALDTSGVVSCWGLAGPPIGRIATGFPACTSCGSGGDPCSATPITLALPPGAAFTHIDGGGDGVYFGYGAAGELWAWGGAFGNAITAMPTPGRIRVGDGTPRIVQADQYGHLCVRTDTGDVFCVGANDRGQLGRGVVSPSDGRLLPVVWP
jgi:alpha-tubulin suppressor-like RCC1 family protein